MGSPLHLGSTHWAAVFIVEKKKNIQGRVGYNFCMDSCTMGFLIVFGWVSLLLFVGWADWKKEGAGIMELEGK